MRLGVVGGGVVGHAMARAFMEHSEGGTRVYDVVPERCTHSLEDVLSCDLIFVCLPTPANEDGSCKTSFVEQFFRDVGTSAFADRNFVLRSTVPVGTTKKLGERYGVKNLVHSPEFLTARCSVADAQVPARNIVGIPHPSAATSLLAELYKRRFPGIPVHITTSDESEAVKLMQNSFFLTKIAIFNEFYQFAQARGMNWSRVLAGLLSDGRIAHAHTQVPGVDGLFGAGGACLPKDIANLVHCMGDEAVVIRAAMERNKRDRERVA